MAKILSNSIKISKSRNVKRPLGKAGLRSIKRCVKILTKKYNRKNINARNATIKARNLENILNEDVFINAIPNDINIDHEIHINENYYQYNTNPEESDLSFSNNDEQLYVDENEINTIFDQF